MSTLYSTLSFFVICIAWLFYNFPSVVPMYLLVKSHIYIYWATVGYWRYKAFSMLLWIFDSVTHCIKWERWAINIDMCYRQILSWLTGRGKCQESTTTLLRSIGELVL